MPNLSASFLFSGYSDYWPNYRSRGRGQGYAFASYGRDTTLRDLVDQWVEDSWINDYDFKDLPESVTQNDVRAAILESMTDAGRADYESDIICSFSEDWVKDNNLDSCVECGERVNDSHDIECSRCDDDTVSTVTEDDCANEDDCESPIAIMLIEWDV